MAVPLWLHGSRRRPLGADFRRHLHDQGDQARAWHAPRRPAESEETCPRRGPRARRHSEHTQPHSMTPDIIDIYTDGACKGNPGPGGWGALLRFGDQEKELFGGEPNTTNNRMELMGVIAALEALKRPCKAVVHTDSQYVQKGISEWIHGWKKKNWMTAAKTPVKNADLWKRLDALVQQHEIEWRWVKGHAGHPENERADALANRGVAALAES